nr:uncharacterized protein LOC109150044 [Ipomoea batatas]
MPERHRRSTAVRVRRSLLENRGSRVTWLLGWKIGHCERKNDAGTGDEQCWFTIPSPPLRKFPIFVRRSKAVVALLHQDSAVGCRVTPPGRRDDVVAAPCSVKPPSTEEGSFLAIRHRNAVHHRQAALANRNPLSLKEGKRIENSSDLMTAACLRRANRIAITRTTPWTREEKVTTTKEMFESTHREAVVHRRSTPLSSSSLSRTQIRRRRIKNDESAKNRIGKVESQQSVFNRLGASPKEVKKSVHEKLGHVRIIKNHTNSPLGVEPSKEFKSVVPSRMRREANVNVLCGKVLEGRPKITVHTSVQEENEESMESSYATYQSGQDVEVPQELEGWKLAGRDCLPGYTELGSLLHANLSIGKASLIQIKGLPI